MDVDSCGQANSPFAVLRIKFNVFNNCGIIVDQKISLTMLLDKY